MAKSTFRWKISIWLGEQQKLMRLVLEGAFPQQAVSGSVLSAHHSRSCLRTFLSAIPTHSRCGERTFLCILAVINNFPFRDALDIAHCLPQVMTRFGGWASHITAKVWSEFFTLIIPFYCFMQSRWCTELASVIIWVVSFHPAGTYVQAHIQRWTLG